MLKDDVDMAPHFGKILQMSVRWGRVSFPHPDPHPHPPTNVSPSPLHEEEKKRREGPSIPYRRLQNSAVLQGYIFARFRHIILTGGSY